jgi:hypothetical protein
VKSDLPGWAMKRATADDIIAVRQAQKQGYLQIKWPPLKEVRAWAKQQGWHTPWFGFESAFIKTVLDTEQALRLALSASVIELTIPRESYTITAERLQILDDLYTDVGSTGSHQLGWGVLVGALREIRRAVEAGVEVSVPDKASPLRSFQGFYEWAHGRYHMLEDGYDRWIGDDNS